MQQLSARKRSNEEWLAALRGRDGPVVEELGSYLRRVLARILRPRRLSEDDLSDLTQEGLLRILEKLDSFRGDSAFTTWATAVATRVAFTQLRRQGVRERGRTDFDEARVDALSLERPRPALQDDVLSRGHLLAELERAMATALTERQRIAVVAELRGVPTVELAERLGTNPNALYKLHHDARKKLRSALVEAGFTAEDIRQHVTEASGS